MAIIKKSVLFLIVLASLSSFYSVSYGADPQKIGVLVMGAGMNGTYQPDWITGYMEHFFPVYMPGMMAGGDLEGGSCLSLIHYANPEEAAVCSQVRGKQIPQGTPIDIFCNEYQNDSYPVHSIFKHRLFGKSGFLKTVLQACCLILSKRATAP